MASAFSHVIVAGTLGLGLRPPQASLRFWLLGALCSVIPDLDVLGFWLGIPYEDTLGHRGLTHSFLFAAALGGLVIAIPGHPPQWSGLRGRLFLYFFACTASHGVLDAMTNGGLGVAFFAPFDNRRYFLPLRPIEVSPLAPGEFFTGWGATVLASEIRWVWIPCLSAITLLHLIHRLWRPVLNVFRHLIG